jgi:hypothetical protein
MQMRHKDIGRCRKLHNEELHNLHSSPNIIWVIKSRSGRQTQTLNYVLLQFEKAFMSTGLLHREQKATPVTQHGCPHLHRNAWQKIITETTFPNLYEHSNVCLLYRAYETELQVGVLRSIVVCSVQNYIKNQTRFGQTNYSKYSLNT